jgi:hypothetical protein
LPFVNLVDGPSDFGVLAQLPLDSRVRLPLQCYPDLYTDPPLCLAAHYPPDSVRILKSVYILGFLLLLLPGATVFAIPAFLAIFSLAVFLAVFLAISLASLICLAA